MKRSLVEVDISALGVIEKARFAPGAGLTVITGETGAGKTMVLGSLTSDGFSSRFVRRSRWK